ncbi:MAG: dihydrodipicolinate synthase family protein [Bryobacterales bacterium]|nr:dihydrodipicolinate synthase family protein [Bryobacterales bacterium]
MPLFEGVMAASVTPRRTDSYEPNLAAFLETIDFLCSFPLDGIVVLGTTGEMVHFDLPERVKILEFARKRAALPVIAGVTHSTLEGTVELAQHAVQIGCAGLVVMPPYYFRYEQEEIKSFYRELARRVGVRVPILAYHIPAFTNPIALDTVWQLVEEGAVSGIKDSSGDRARMRWLIEKRETRAFHLLNGDDRLLREVWRSEGVGAISGVACAVPELFLAFRAAMRDGDEARADQLDALVQDFCDWFDEFPNTIAVKEAVALRRRLVAPPATPLSFERQKKLVEFQAWFEGWLAEVQAVCAVAGKAS